MRSLALTLSLVFAAPLLATEDRENSTPTGWAWYYGQSATGINNIVSAGYRIVDIRVESTSPLTYTAAFVSNAGSYQKGWWYYYNVSGAQISSYLSTNNARLTALDAYDDGAGNARFVCAMISNTGADAKGWWWTYNTTPTGIANVASANTARPILVREYKLGSTTYYASVLLHNTGADARGWWHWYGVTPSFLQTQASTNAARVQDICSSGAAGTYDAVIVKESSVPKWFHYYGVSEQWVNDWTGNLGTRLIAVERTGSTFNVVMLENLNATSRRTNDAMRAASDGWVGAYLKRANSSVLAGFHQSRIFEPASTIKTCIHAYAMKQVELGNDSLSANVTVYTGTSGSCPQYSAPVTETLQTVLQKMMENSDNNRTLAASDRYGVATINSNNNAQGWGTIDINHRIGCGGASPNVPNTMTLVDIGELHEDVINGYLGNSRQTFYNLMLQTPDNYGGLGAVMSQEAASVGLNASQLSAFKAAMAMAYKGGSYGYGSPLRYFYSYGAYVSLPFYTNSGIVDREYVTGVFIDEATNNTNIGNALNVGSAEVLRDIINQAMQTWKDHVAGSFTTFGSACKGTNNLFPSHAGFASAGQPNISTGIAWQLSLARTSTAAALYIGSSKNVWGSFLLPLNMGPFGMPTCYLYTSIDVALSTTTNGSGNASIAFTIPNVASLIGAHVYTQYGIVDAGANALNVVHSNALDTVVGGQK